MKKHIYDNTGNPRERNTTRVGTVPARVFSKVERYGLLTVYIGFDVNWKVLGTQEARSETTTTFSTPFSLINILITVFFDKAFLKGKIDLPSRVKVCGLDHERRTCSLREALNNKTHLRLTLLVWPAKILCVHMSGHKINVINHLLVNNLNPAYQCAISLNWHHFSWK